MPVVVIPEIADDLWNLSEWLEVMEASRPGQSSFSPQQSVATEVIRVPANKVRSCVTQLLGYSLADNTAFRLLRPKVPICHPWFRNLWADSVSIRDMNPLANPDFAGSTAGTYKPKKDADSFLDYGPDYTSNYGMSYVTVTFRNYLWTVWKDSDPNWQPEYDSVTSVYRYPEWKRLVARGDIVPRLDLLTAEGTSDYTMYFAEEDAGGSASPTPGTGGSTFPGAVYFRKQQTGYQVIWRGVEEQYLAGAYPTDIQNGIVMPVYPRLDRFLGCVNSKAFLGHRKNTLLFSGYHAVAYPFPCVRTNYEFGLIGVDVYFQFDAYRPPKPASVKNSAGAVIPDADRKDGHLLFPWRPNVNKYSFATSYGTIATRGTYSGAFALEEQNFYSLFYHAGDTAYPVPP